MKQRANGIDFEEVEEREGVESISRHTTFDEDTDDPEKIAKFVEILADSVHGNLMKNSLLFRTVTIVACLIPLVFYSSQTTELEFLKTLILKILIVLACSL